MLQGLYEGVGFHDWDEYLYALSGNGVGRELADHPEMECVTSVTTLMEPTNPSNDGTGKHANVDIGTHMHTCRGRSTNDAHDCW